MAESQCGDLLFAANEKAAGPNQEAAGSQFDQSCKGDFRVTFSVGTQDMELPAEDTDRRLHL
jgi:hypothetical protein